MSARKKNVDAQAQAQQISQNNFRLHCDRYVSQLHKTPINCHSLSFPVGSRDKSNNVSSVVPGVGRFVLFCVISLIDDPKANSCFRAYDKCHNSTNGET